MKPNQSSNQPLEGNTRRTKSSRPEGLSTRSRGPEYLIFDILGSYFQQKNVVLLVRLTRIVPPQSWTFMGVLDKGCATAGKYENVTNSFTQKWTHKNKR